MKPNAHSRLLTLLLLLAGLLVPSVFAQPEYINYQGRLNDAAGQPLATGNYTLEFRIYDDPVASQSANLVWGPFLLDGATAAGHGPAVSIVSGRFNVILGPEDAALRSIRTAFAGENRFLEIRVNNGAPILPRQQFLSTPYAIKAHGVINNLNVPGMLSVSGHAEVQGNLNVQGQITGSSGDTTYHLVPRGGIILWSGAITNVPAGWALCDGQNGTPDLRDRFVMGPSSAQPNGLIGETGGTTNHLHAVNIPQVQSTTVGGGTIINEGVGGTKAATGPHSHNVDPPSTDSALASHLPPFIRLGFIMKL
jgi:hypothetical protein